MGGDREVLAKVTSMLEHRCTPLEDTLSAPESSFSDGSFFPAAVRLYNENNDVCTSEKEPVGLRMIE